MILGHFPHFTSHRHCSALQFGRCRRRRITAIGQTDCRYLEKKAKLDRHQKQATPLVVEQWEQSRHAAVGIACFECHQADKSRPEAFQHYGQMIAVIVSPNRCGACHGEEVKQFEASHHAAAGEILGSLDNVLGDVVEGPPASVSGCQKCHGSRVKVLAGETGPAHLAQ